MLLKTASPEPSSLIVSKPIYPTPNIPLKPMLKQNLCPSLLAMVALTLTAATATAQVGYDPQSENPFPSGDVNENTGTLDGIDPFELIHRSRLNNGRSASEFQEESNQQLDDAALDFKRQQQQRLENPSSAQPGTLP